MHAALGFLSSKAFNEKGGTLDMILELHLVLPLENVLLDQKDIEIF